MIPEAGAQIQIVSGQKGVALPAGDLPELRGGAGGHEAQKAFRIELNGPFPGDAGMGETFPEGLHRQRFNMVGHNGVAVGQPRTQAPAQVDQIDDQRYPGFHPDRDDFLARGPAQPEHFLHGPFMGETDQVMNGPAAFRRKGCRLRVGQMEGRHDIQQVPEPAADRALQKRPDGNPEHRPGVIHSIVDSG